MLARDAYGLLRGAIRENNPVFVLEHKGLYNLKEDVPDDTGPMPLGQALVRRAGTDDLRSEFIGKVVTSACRR